MGWRENTHRETVRWFKWMAAWLALAYAWTDPVLASAVAILLVAILSLLGWLNRRYP